MPSTTSNEMEQTFFLQRNEQFVPKTVVRTNVLPFVRMRVFCSIPIQTVIKAQ